MALSMEERKAKLQARMQALQEQLERVERGEPMGGARGRAPNPMGSTEDFAALTRYIKSLKGTGATYATIAGVLSGAIEGLDDEEKASLTETGTEKLAEFPAAKRKSKSAETED